VGGARGCGRAGSETDVGGVLMGLRQALRMFRASVEAVPPGAARPSTTLWLNSGQINPPVSWIPQSGVFETHWDWSSSWAWAIPAYWRARMLISQSVGAMPIGAWRGDVAVDPLPAVLRAPNPDEDRCSTVAAWVGDLVDHGNAVGIVTAWDSAIPPHPAAVLPVPCTSVGIGRTSSGRLVYDVAGASYDSSEMFHAKGVTLPGQDRGIGILEAGLSTIDRVTAESAYAAKAFASGVPSGLLRVRDPDLQVGTDDDPAGYVTAKGIKKAWQASVGTGDVAVLSELVDFTPLSWTPSDAQMVEARQMSLVDMANMFNLDPYWVGSSQVSAPYQNVQDAAVQLSRFTLNFWITALEAQFSRLLVRGQEARFNRDSILRDPQSVRVDNYVKMIGAGFMTVDEARAREGLPPLDTPSQASVTPLFPAGDSTTNQPAVGA
jgi:HK97 family phage portal protein